MKQNTALGFLLFLVCLQYFNIRTTFALYSCFGYSSNSESVCGNGRGICQGTGSCYCIDSQASNAIYSSWSGRSNILIEGNSLYSSNGAYYAKQQADGNLVVYTSSNSVIWASNTQNAGSGSYRLVLETDGTLRIKGQGGGSVVKDLAGSCGGTPPYRLIMQNDGNFVLYGAQKEVCWKSDTFLGGTNDYLFSGSSCSTTSCYGISSDSGSVCSGHGSCNNRDTCSC